MSTSGAVRLFEVVQGMPGLGEKVNEAMAKHANAKASGLMRGLKIGGAALGLGGAGAAAYKFGENQGEASGMASGRQMQHAEDMQAFRGQARSIYQAGAQRGMAIQRQSDVRQFSNYLKNNLPGMMGTSSPNATHQQKKIGEDRLAAATVDAWERGQFTTAQMQSLNDEDMAKVATVLIKRRAEGSKAAEMLWNALRG